MYYRGAVAAVLVYDITSVSSFHAVKGWIKGEAPVMSSQSRSNVVIANTTCMMK
jgi:GTPase SAR1 family protein